MNQEFVMIMHGTTGSGKSTLARRLTKCLGVELLSTSQIKNKKGWRGIEYDTRRHEVYSLITGYTREKVMHGKSVLVDATYSLRRWREDMYSLCSELDAPLYIVHCVCDDPIEVARRISLRNKENALSPDSEANHVGYWITEKKNIEELLVDRFPKPEKIFILACDTYRKVVTPLVLPSGNPQDELFNRIQEYMRSSI